jgi:hypothetical protein
VFIEREDSSCLSRRCLNSGGRTVKRERNPDRHAAITGAWIKVSLWRPKLRRFGKPPGLHSIKMVASVVADQQGAITFHHTISRLSLIILGLRLRRATWRNEGVGIARLMTVVCKNSGARELWRLHRCLTNFLIMKRNGRSATNFIASAGAYHTILRSRFSGHFLYWRVTRRGKTWTRQLAVAPRGRTFTYGKEPIDRFRTLPTTPASSNASRAAVAWEDMPGLGQPFGIIQRRVRRDVTSITSSRDLPLARYGSAAY